MPNSMLPGDSVRAADYKSVMAKALLEHSKLTTRQENDPDTDIGELFTDNNQLLTLEKTDWQILYGRRGTGKTTLLHKLAEVLDKQEGRATLTISLQKCIVDLPADTPSRIYGLVQFEKFVMEIGFLLYRIYLNRTSAKNKNKKITALLNKYWGEERIVQSSILKIATFAQKGKTYGSLKEKKETVSTSQETSNAYGAGGKIDISLFKKAEDFTAFANAEVKRNAKLMRDAKYEETAYIDFSELKRDFVELLDALKINTLFILIDEWSALDRRAAPRNQVHFAEYLKRAFFGTSRICLKISAIEHESRFEEVIDGSRHGLEVGADIFAQVNLDEIYNNRVINLKEFFGELIYRRLQHCDKRIAGIFKNRDDESKPIADFLDVMFEDKDGFNEIVRASGGIPRDFINRFDAIAANHNHTIETKWQSHRIQDVVMRASIKRQVDVVDNNDPMRCVFDKIANVVTATGRRIFFISRGGDPALLGVIDELFADRMVHKLDPAIVPREMRSQYTAYYIDYGSFLDLTKRKKRVEGAADIVWPFENGAVDHDFKEHVVELASCSRES